MSEPTPEATASTPEPTPGVDPTPAADPSASGADPATGTPAATNITTDPADLPQGEQVTTGPTEVAQPVSPYPVRPTAPDAQGVERVTSPFSLGNWKPAPVEATPEQRAQGEEREALLEAQQERSRQALGLGDSEPERAVNAPNQGASQNHPAV